MAQTHHVRRGFWVGVTLLASGLIAATVLALSWTSANWPFDSMTGYAVSTPPPSVTQVEFVSTGTPSQTVARLKLNTMPTHRENTTGTFTGTRAGILWSTDHFEFPSTSVPLERDANAASLKALWRFNEASGATVLDTTNGISNVNVNNGTMSGTPSRIIGNLFDAYGNPGKALEFDGANSMTVSPDDTELRPSSLSVEAWVQFTALAGNQGIVLKKFDGFDYNPWELVKSSSNTLQFSVSTGLTLQRTAVSAVTVTTGQWYYVVGTYDGSTARIYVNGALSGTSASGAAAIDYKVSAGPLATLIGGTAFISPGARLAGYLDEVALYNVPLSAATIAANYAAMAQQFNPRLGSYTSLVIDAGPAVTQWMPLAWAEGPLSGLGEELANTLPGLQGLWHFNESPPATAALDVAGVVANNGTLTNGPTWSTGKFGNALYFNGTNNYVQATHTVANPNPFAGVTNNWTLEAWVYYTGSGGSANGAAVVYTGDASSGRGYGLWRGGGIFGNQNLITVRYGDTYFFTGAPYDLNAWNHIVAVRSAGTLTVYKNGVQAGLPLLTAPTAPGSADPIVIGGLSGSDGFQGLIDEVALYSSSPLALATIQAHYRQGSLNLRVQGRSGPTATPDATWSPWKPADGAPVSNLTYGLQGLWHMDGNPNDDTGGPTNTTANTLTLNGGPTYVAGKFSQGLSLNGTTHSASVATPMTAIDNWTLEAWVNYNSTGGGVAGAGIVYNGTAGTNGYGIWRGNASNANLITVRYGNTVFNTGVAYDVNSWNHIVAVRDNGALTVYKNGVLIGSTDLDGAVSPVTPTGSLQVGTQFGGLIDEVAIYNVALDAHAIFDHYLGAAFTTSPATLLGTIPDNRYFQFRTFFSSDKMLLTPTLFSVTINAQNYAKAADGAPTIINTGLTPLYSLLNSLTETRGPAAGQGEIKYQLSPNGTTWYWFSGGAWAPAASDQAQSNTAAQLTPAAMAMFPLTPAQGGAGPGNLQWKAVLISDGQQPVELDDLVVQYAPDSLTMVAPAAAATWLTGNTYTIQWNKTGMLSAVKLWYAADGSNFTTVVDSTPNDGSYDWTIPAGTAVSINSNPGQGASRIKISGAEVGSESLEAVSALFTVSRLVLTAPAANTTWLVGKPYAVTWTTTATDATKPVTLEYAKDGSTFTSIGTVSATAGTFSWTPGAADVSVPISNPNTGISQIRLSYVDAPTEFTSTPMFTVTQFNVIAPIANDTWRLGKQHTIQWEASATGLNQVKIEYAPDGATWNEVPTAPSALPFAPVAYTWDLPGTDLSFLSCDVATPLACPTPGGLIRVTVIDPPGLAVLTNTSAAFTVTRPFMRITEPHAGEILGVGTVKGIEWEKEGLIGTNLRIEYSTNSFLDESQTVVIVNGDNGGTIPVVTGYEWVVPDEAASPTVRIRIIDLLLPEGTGTSEQFKVAGSINIAPIAGLKWAVGKPHSIQWTTTGQISNVTIELSKDGGVTFPTVVAASVPNGVGGGTYAWTPAAADASANAVIRLSDAADPQVKKESAAFLVTDATVTNPAGGERWLVGDATKTITWTQTGLTNVRLEYSTDGTTFPYVIAATVPAAGGSLAWTVPDTIKKDTVTIRLLDADATGAAQAEGRSNSFTIHGQLNVTAPTGTDIWNSGQPHTITWTTPAGTGTIPNVQLEYSVDAFVCAPGKCVVITASTSNTNNYVWTPSFTAGDIVKVRVSDAQDPLTASTSGFFEVPGIAMQQPAGGEVWPVGSTGKEIQWGYTGSFTAVKLEYSTDDFTNSTLITSSAPNFGSYTWAAIPDAISTNVKIRVTPVDDPATPADESTLFSITNPFTIQGVLRVTSPNGGPLQIFDVGSMQTINWEATGTMPSVELLLSTNNGGAWTPLTTVNSALGGGTSPVLNAYPWTVPPLISVQAKVRVRDAVAGHPVSEDDSDTTFTIRAAFGLVEPNAGSTWGVYQSPTQPDPIPPITWTSQGNVTNVKLEYSVDDFACSPASNCGTIAAQTPNDGSFDWSVPDLISPMLLAGGGAPGDGALAHVRQVRVRVSDADAGHPAAAASSAPFTVKWFRIFFNILDEDNLQQLNNLSVNDQTSAPQWIIANDTLNPSIYHYYPYGNFTATWSNANYFSNSVTWTAIRDGSATAIHDKRVTVLLLSKLAEQVPYLVRVEQAYDPAIPDAMKFKVWLEKRGQLVGVKVNDLANMGAATIEVFDGTTVMTSLSQATPDANGTYDFTPWANTGLQAGNVYFAKASVVFPTSTTTPPGTVRTSGGGINISIPQQIEAIDASSTGVTLTELQTQLTPIATDVTAIKTETVGPASTLGQAAATVGALPQAITNAQSAIQADVAGVAGQVGALQGTADAIKVETDLISTQVVPGLTSIETKVDGVQAYLADPNAGLPKILANTDALANAAKAQRRGGLLNRDMSLDIGETATIQYRGEGGAVNLNVYNQGGALLGGIPPLSLNPATGLYETTFTAAAAGEFRAVATELASADSSGTVDSLTMTVRAPRATAQAVSGVQTSLDALTTQITAIESDVDGLVLTAAAIQATTDATKTQADSIKADAQALLAKWGVLDANALMTGINGLAADLGAVRAKTDTILWSDVTAAKSAADAAALAAGNAEAAALSAQTTAAAILTEIGVGNIAAIRTKTDTITWADVTGLVTTAGAIQLKTDPIDWTQVAAIKTATDTINWADVTGLVTTTGAIQANMATEASVQSALAGLATLQGDLAALAVQVGTPAQEASVQSALAQIATVQSDLTALTAQIGTPAQAAALQAVADQVTAVQSAIAALPGAINYSARFDTLDSVLNGLVLQMGTPSQEATLTGALGTLNNIQTSMATAADLQTKYDALVLSLGGLSTQIGTPAQDAVIQALANQVTAIQTAIAALPGAVDYTPQFTALNNSLNALSGAVGTPSQALALQAVANDVTALQTAIAALPGAVDYTPQLATLQNDLTSLRAAVNDPAQAAALTQALGILATVQTDVSALQAPADFTESFKAVDAALGGLNESVITLQASVGSSTDETLIAKLDSMDDAVKSAAGSSAAVGLSQSAFAAASEAVTILQQLQAEIKANGKGSTLAPMLLGKFGDKMGEIEQAVTVIPGELDTAAVSKQLAQLAEGVKTLASEKGYNFDSLFQMSESQGGDVKSIRNHVTELKALVEIQKSILEQKLNEPVVKTWFETGY